MKDKIYNSFKRFEFLNDEVLDAITEKLSFKTFKRNQILFEPGNECKEMYFILNGIANSYAMNEKGVKMVLNFFHEDDWIEDIGSIYLDLRVRFFYATIENCEVLTLSKEDLLSLTARFPSLKKAMDKMYINYILNLQDRYLSQVTKPARERYDDFIDLHSFLALRLPQKLLASYLGVTPEFLSKMRGQR